MIAQAVVASEGTDMTLLFTYNAWKNQGQKDLVHQLADLKQPLIVIALRDPQDCKELTLADVLISTCSPAASSIQEAIKLIKNGSIAQK